MITVVYKWFLDRFSTTTGTMFDVMSSTCLSPEVINEVPAVFLNIPDIAEDVSSQSEDTEDDFRRRLRQGHSSCG